MAMAVLYERVCGELLEATAWCGFTQIAGTAHGAKVQRGKQFDAKAFSEGRASLSDRDVDSIGGEVREDLACKRSHVDGGMSARESAQAGHKPLRCERWRHADGDLFAIRLQFLGGAVDNRERAADRAVIAAADLSEPQSARFAAKKLKPQVGFKAPYLLRDET